MTIDDLEAGNPSIDSGGFGPPFGKVGQSKLGNVSDISAKSYFGGFLASKTVVSADKIPSSVPQKQQSQEPF